MNSPDSRPSAIKRAMILSAGLGTRFRPWTDRHPKALAVINGKSLLQRNIEYLQRYGISEVVINVHHFSRQVIDALTTNDGWGSEYSISDESGALLETGGGLQKARSLLEDGPFVLMNVDILTDMDLSDLIGDHIRHRPLATLAVTDRTTTRYFLFDDRDELCGWRNDGTGEERMARTPIGAVLPKAFSGIHVIEPTIFHLMKLRGKFSMVDLYLDLADNYPIRAHDHSRSRLIDVGRPESAEQAARMFP